MKLQPGARKTIGKAPFKIHSTLKTSGPVEGRQQVVKRREEENGPHDSVVSQRESSNDDQARRKIELMEQQWNDNQQRRNFKMARRSKSGGEVMGSRRLDSHSIGQIRQSNQEFQMKNSSLTG